MSVKFSEIEKITERKLIIENGKPFWQEHVLSGEINFKPIDETMIEEIRKNILPNLQKNISDEECTYMLIPYMTDIIDDIDLERFKGMIKSKNDVALVLMDGILDLFSNAIDYAEQVNKVVEKAQKLEEKVPKIDIKEVQKKELEELYNKFAIVTDKKERDIILKRVIELKNELGE